MLITPKMAFRRNCLEEGRLEQAERNADDAPEQAVEGQGEGDGVAEQQDRGSPGMPNMIGAMFATMKAVHALYSTGRAARGAPSCGCPG